MYKHMLLKFQLQHDLGSKQQSRKARKVKNAHRLRTILVFDQQCFCYDMLGLASHKRFISFKAYIACLANVTLNLGRTFAQ